MFLFLTYSRHLLQRWNSYLFQVRSFAFSSCVVAFQTSGTSMCETCQSFEAWPSFLPQQGQSRNLQAQKWASCVPSLSTYCLDLSINFSIKIYLPFLKPTQGFHHGYSFERHGAFLNLLNVFFQGLQWIFGVPQSINAYFTRLILEVLYNVPLHFRRLWFDSDLRFAFLRGCQ